MAPLRSHYRLTADKRQNFILPKLPSATSCISESLYEMPLASLNEKFAFVVYTQSLKREEKL